MKKHQIVKWIMFAIALATNIFILANGFVSGDSSAVESNNIAHFLETIINFFNKDTINPSNFDDFASIIRKLVGHFGLFAFDGVFSTLAIYYFVIDRKWFKIYMFIILSLALGLLVAIISELAQLITPDRYGSWADVGIDFGGYFLAFLIVFLILFFSKKLQSQKS